MVVCVLLLVHLCTGSIWRAKRRVWLRVDFISSRGAAGETLQQNGPQDGSGRRGLGRLGADERGELDEFNHISASLWTAWLSHMSVIMIARPWWPVTRHQSDHCPITATFSRICHSFASLLPGSACIWENCHHCASPRTEVHYFLWSKVFPDAFFVTLLKFCTFLYLVLRFSRSRWNVVTMHSMLLFRYAHSLMFFVPFS